jgi:IS30 family transposase
VERKSQLAPPYYPIAKSDRVSRAISQCLRPLAKKAHTLTLDSGKELASHQHVKVKPQLPIYFADRYSAWQRG